MVLGVGTDILKIGRISDSLTGGSDVFITKTFTPREREEASQRSDPGIYFATRFAGKEAVFKCLGIDSNGIRLNEVEIIGTQTGQPQVVLLGKAKEIATTKRIKRIDISLSYDTDYAVAFAVAQG
jgi:holo-[acyl-carrier protein] synthase